MNNPIDDPLLTMAGECAVQLILEEADAALNGVDWDALKNVNLDEWFEQVTSPQREKKKPVKRSLPRRVLLYAASLLLFVLISSTVVFATYEPARAALIRFIVERFPRYSEYFIRREEHEVAADMVFTQPEYIPEGFELIVFDDTPVSRVLYWLNESTNQFIAYDQINGESSIMLDTEDAVTRQEVINGITVEVIEKGDVTKIQFFHNDMCFVVSGDISYEECVAVVETIPLHTAR